MITHFVPYPPNAGNLQRNYNLLREISKTHDVHLITLTQRTLLPEKTLLDQAIEKLSGFCTTIQVFPIPSDRNRLLWYLLLLGNIFSTVPYSVWRFHSCKMKKSIQKFLKKITIDVIHVDTIDLAGYALPYKFIPKVLNHHNIESNLLFRRANFSKNPLKKWYINFQAKKVRSFERQVLPLFDYNITVSPIDQSSLVELAHNCKTTVVANGTDTDFFIPTHYKHECTIIFAGGFHWIPNADAMYFFCSEIFPLIQREIAEVKMKIIGDHPPRELSILASNNSGINILGFVPDIREHFARAAVQVVPLRIGGGTRLKILDGLAMGKAVVSTSIGAEGLELRDGFNILFADTVEAFATKVIKLLKNPRIRERLGKNGRSTVEKKYSWRIITPVLINTYSSLLKNEKGSMIS